MRNARGKRQEKPCKLVMELCVIWILMQTHLNGDVLTDPATDLISLVDCFKLTIYLLFALTQAMFCLCNLHGNMETIDLGN